MPEDRRFLKLLVEGNEDKRVIPYLMEANGITWGAFGTDVPDIRPTGGINELLKPLVIETELAESNLTCMGIVCDADDAPRNRWQQLRNRFRNVVPNLPEALPRRGVVRIINTEHGDIRFGIWMMPDCRTHGMMETFLAYLVPNADDPTLTYARSASTTAKRKGATFKGAHKDKAIIHTWLAWNDPPGRQLHDAVKFGILNPRSPHAVPFVSWFRELFQI